MKFGVRFAILLATLTPSLAWAAPDEDVLGKAQGYPYCVPKSSADSEPCLVGLYSHFDRLVASSRVAKAAAPSELKREAAERKIAYVHRGQPRDIDAFLADNRNTGLLILSGDRILVERYQYGRNAEDRFQSMSMAKTVVAMLMGIALEEGKIASLDDLAQKYVPELKGHPYGETKLRDLLTMSSGVAFTERYDGKDDSAELGRRTVGHEGRGGAATLEPFRDHPREHPAGTHFSYASAESQTLGLVLRAAVGKPLAEYLAEKIWQPMGAESDATWAVDAGGYELGFMGINATLRDWARFGRLLANDGALDGRQIIPAAWVRAATVVHAPHLAVGTATKYNGYGYQTWLVSDRARVFAALGLRGQAIFVDPDTKLVIVHTAVYGLSQDSRAEQFSLFLSLARQLRHPS